MFTAASYLTSTRARVCCMVLTLNMLFFSPTALAGISLNQTRVIFSATEKAHTLTVKNTGGQTYLIQSRVQQTATDTTAAPFLVTPPLVFIRPDSNQLLRIVPQQLAVPTDRESVFYLSVMAIPTRGEKENAPIQLSMGLRFVIKLFYRPTGLAPPERVTPCPLRIQRADHHIQIDNPTPYFQTLGRLVVDHRPYTLDMAFAMIAPFSSRTYPLAQTATLVEWQVITDYGGLSTPTCQQTINPYQEAP